MPDDTKKQLRGQIPGLIFCDQWGRPEGKFLDIKMNNTTETQPQSSKGISHMSAGNTILILKLYTGFRVAVVQAVENIVEYRDAKVMADYFNTQPDYATLDQAFAVALQDEAILTESDGQGAEHGIRIFVWDGPLSAVTFQYFGIMDRSYGPCLDPSQSNHSMNQKIFKMIHCGMFVQNSFDRDVLMQR